MTVDESPVSPPHHAPSKSKTSQTTASSNAAVTASPPSGASLNDEKVTSPAAQRLPQGSPRPPTNEPTAANSIAGVSLGGASQTQTLNRSNSPSSNSPLNRSQNNGAMAAPRSPVLFENYAQGNPSKAREILEQLTEVTGVRDTSILYKAFNQTRKGDQFNVTLAIEWILNLPPDYKERPQIPDLAPINDGKRGPLSIATTRQDVATSASAVPMQPPNSPNSNPGTSVSSNRNLVDLTDSAPSSTQNKPNAGSSNTNEDAELEKAIQLSLQDQARPTTTSHGPPGMSQEDQDVSRALEASLAEHTGGYGKRRKDGSWADPLNPHDRERNGIWPVGLKNVGQTCWFSAVIQSLFYLPVFRTLVLNYRPSIPTSGFSSDERRNSDKCQPMESHGQQSITMSDDSRHKKIVEFMMELRKLFALLVASQRKYVDPTRAVDILRASFGGASNVIESDNRSSSIASAASNILNTGDQGSEVSCKGSTPVNTNGTKNVSNTTGNVLTQNSNVLIMMDNNQQDVSEFTHIVLEWVEEAFKKHNPALASSPAMISDNKEELMEEGSVGADGLPRVDNEDEKENNEEKANEDVDDEDISEKEHDSVNFLSNEGTHYSSEYKNPMTELFYGQVLTEGSIQGEEFIRSEAFGQWPLQVNTYKDIHETLENSTAHEYFDQAATVTTPSGGVASNQVSSILSSPNSGSVPSSVVPSSGQERWFTKLPPVLVLELSRFHFNTERKAAEKIHNRLEFSEKIYMDRYMHTNKTVTRRKRDEVRRLKEKRAHLKARLEKFSKYQGTTNIQQKVDNPNDIVSSSISPEVVANTFLPLPEILQYALDFANAGEGRVSSSCSLTTGMQTRGCDVSMSSPSNDAHGSSSNLPNQPLAGPVQHLHQQSAMQIDSPCGSPKVTPASSVSNLNSAHGIENVKDAVETPMDVCDESMLSSECVSSNNKTFSNTNVQNTGNLREAASESVTATTPHLMLHGSDNNSSSSSTIGGSSISPQTSRAVNDSDLGLENQPCPRHISEQELHVLQNCLSRWKEEVTKDMLNLQTAIKDIDHKIESMYEEENLKQLEYELHAVMVHEGGVDSGHYWAYVKDHKKQVWLKFNDNTVNEASWEELLKESIGGRSNTSAYSLVYIDASKPEILLPAILEISGDPSEECMEEGDIEFLVQNLPRDLAEFVHQNNSEFKDECIRWGKEQEERKRLEESQQELAQQQAQGGSSGLNSSGMDPNSDVLVVQEKLTHVNTHAKLSIDITFKAIKAVENIIRKEGTAVGIQHAMEKTIQFYHKKLDREQNMQNSSGNNGTMAFGSNTQGIPDLPSSDLRLESFCAYLLRNHDKDRVLELCLLEQFSLPGLDAQNDQVASEFRKVAEQMLRQRRANYQAEATLLKQWHQIYHWFRMSAHCLVSGLDHLCQHQFEESLDMFTEAYNYTARLHEYQLQGQTSSPSRGLRTAHLLRLLCLTLPEVNHCLIKRFRLHENDDKELIEVTKNIRQLVVPVLILLQNRISQATITNTASPQNQGAAQAARTLEDVRSDWCALLGEADASSKAGAAISDVLRMVLEPPNEGMEQGCGGERASKKRREMSVEHTADLMLSQRYIDVRQQLHELMQDDSSNEGETRSANLPSTNTAQAQNVPANQQQVPGASPNSSTKVRVRSGGSDNGSSGGSGGTGGPKVVMM